MKPKTCATCGRSVDGMMARIRMLRRACVFMTKESNDLEATLAKMQTRLDQCADTIKRLKGENVKWKRLAKDFRSELIKTVTGRD